MNETIQSPILKPKRHLTEAQKSALKKGRDALAAKRRAIIQDIQKEEIYEFDTSSPDTMSSVCAGLSIVLTSYFMIFIVCQQL